MRTNTCTTIRPSSRSNGTGPARGYSRAGVTEVSGRRPGAGSSASEQTGEGTAPTRRRRAVRYDRQRPGYRQGADSATPAPQGAGSFYGRGGTRRRPGGTAWPPSPGPGEPAGGPACGAAAFGRPHPTSTHHTTTTGRRTSTEPIILRVCRAAKGLRSRGTRPGSGSHGGTRGISGDSGISGTSEPNGGRGASGTSGREVSGRLKRSQGDLRKTL